MIWIKGVVYKYFYKVTSTLTSGSKWKIHPVMYHINLAISQLFKYEMQCICTLHYSHIINCPFPFFFGSCPIFYVNIEVRLYLNS